MPDVLVDVSKSLFINESVVGGYLNSVELGFDENGHSSEVGVVPGKEGAGVDVIGNGSE